MNRRHVEQRAREVRKLLERAAAQADTPQSESPERTATVGGIGELASTVGETLMGFVGLAALGTAVWYVFFHEDDHGRTSRTARPTVASAPAQALTTPQLTLPSRPTAPQAGSGTHAITNPTATLRSDTYYPSWKVAPLRAAPRAAERAEPSGPQYPEDNVEWLRRHPDCEFKAVMSDRDLRACGIEPPSGRIARDAQADRLSGAHSVAGAASN